jgi:hypothetical protein
VGVLTSGGGSPGDGGALCPGEGPCSLAMNAAADFAV